MKPIIFTVLGLPAPQGSKNRWGAEDNPRTKPWRDSVASSANALMNGDALLTGPVYVEASFVFPRPKGHYRSGARAAELRPDAPAYKSSTPDGDKLARAVGDALSGIVFRDDAQVAVWSIRKVYGEPARAEISVRAL